MVNHVETLLLNMSPKGVSDSPGPVSAWFIDRSFTPVPVPNGLSGMYSALFDGADTVQKRADRVLASVCTALTGELRPYFDVLDPRRTISYSGASSIRGLYSSAGRSCSGHDFVNRMLNEATLSSGLYSGTGVVAMDAAVPELKEISLHCKEAVIRFGADLALLAYQMEAVRRRRMANA